jgi:hypothetical protein
VSACRSTRLEDPDGTCLSAHRPIRRMPMMCGDPAILRMRRLLAVADWDHGQVDRVVRQLRERG